jgi:hypothetical protein
MSEMERSSKRKKKNETESIWDINFTNGPIRVTVVSNLILRIM